MKKLLVIILFPISVSGQSQSISIGRFDTGYYLLAANTIISPPAPQAGTLFQIVSNASTNGRISFDTYNNSSFTGSNYQGRRSRGTAAVPLPPIADDILVAIGADGYGTTGYTGASVGSMNIRAESTFSNTSKPSYVSFTTTPAGSIIQAERLRIKSTGVVQITGLNSVGFMRTDINGNLGTSVLTNAEVVSALGFTPQAAGTYLTAANNLSDLANAGTARTNLGLGTLATQSGTFSGVSSGTNTGDNAVNTTYASDYRAANFIAGTDYLAPAGNGSALTGLTKSQVGLSNVDNTSDANKPVSTATQTALNAKQATITNGSITNAQLANGAVVNLSGTNTGDQTITLTGDISGSGTGSFATAIGANKVINAMLSQIATATFKGRTTAGTGNVEDLTATQATALLNNFTGDAGAGGTKGLVTAPAAGDAAAGKYLKADGTWTAPPGGGGGQTFQQTFATALIRLF